MTERENITREGLAHPDEAEAFKRAGDALGVDVKIVLEGEQYSLGENKGTVPTGKSMVLYRVESDNLHAILMTETAKELQKIKKE